MKWLSGLQGPGQGIERIDAVFQQLFPNSANVEVDDVSLLTTAYHNYKKKYVRHLSFDLKDENCSKVTFMINV